MQSKRKSNSLPRKLRRRKTYKEVSAMRKTLHLVSTILFNVFIFIFGFAMLFTALCKDSYVENMLSTYLFGEGRTETITTGKEPI